MDGWRGNRWVSGQWASTGRWMDECLIDSMDAWMDGWTCHWAGGWMGEWVDE